MNFARVAVQCALISVAAITLVLTIKDIRDTCKEIRDAYNQLKNPPPPASFNMNKAEYSVGENTMVAQSRNFRTKKTEISIHIQNRLMTTYAYSVFALSISAVSSYTADGFVGSWSTRTTTTFFYISTVLQVIFPTLFIRLNKIFPNKTYKFTRLIWICGYINIGFYGSLQKALRKESQQSLQQPVPLRLNGDELLSKNRAMVLYSSLLQMTSRNDEKYYSGIIGGVFLTFVFDIRNIADQKTLQTLELPMPLALLLLSCRCTLFFFKVYSKEEVAIWWSNFLKVRLEDVSNVLALFLTFGHKIYGANSIFKQAKNILFTDDQCNEIDNRDYDEMEEQMKIAVLYPCFYYMFDAIMSRK